MHLHTSIQGEGVPIVFLHTDLQTGESDFIFQGNHFSPNYQVIRPDLRGHGNSFCDDFDNYFDRTAADLKETLDDLEVESAHVVGCSLGALAGIMLARYFPEKVKSLSISGIFPVKPADWKQMHAKGVEEQRQLLRNDEMVKYFNQLHNTNWREFIYLARNENWYPFDQTKDLTNLLIPVLYMVGEENPIEVEGAMIYSKSKSTHVAVIPFANHLVQVDQPEIYSSVLEKFIAEVEG